MSTLICDNRKAFFDYFIEDQYEAGITLMGWEIKAIRSGRASLKEAYVIVKNGELFLLGGHIPPLHSASTHVETDPHRTRKLLMKREEIDRVMGKVDRAGYTLIPLSLYYSGRWVKIKIGVAKGKKQHDKRESEKERQWNRDKQRIMKQR
ncbi:MAG: SsrA-binding protein SmpB [Pseudomonadota bacterium]